MPGILRQGEEVLFFADDNITAGGNEKGKSQILGGGNLTFGS